MEQQSSLPEAWTDRIFDKLMLTYGSAWLKKWEGVEIAQIKADWGHELRGFQQSPHAIKFALEHLPAEFPPTVLQFRDVCLKAPQYAPKALPAPTPDPAVVAAVVRAFRPQPYRPAKFWAYALRDREEAGDRLTITQRTMWRDALQSEQRHEGDAA